MYIPIYRVQYTEYSCIYIYIHIYPIYIERKRDPSNACMGSVCVRASDM